MAKKIHGMSAMNAGSDYTDEQREFMLALDRYKRERERPFPSWDEVLRVARSLGYRKVAPPQPLPRFPVE